MRRVVDFEDGPTQCIQFHVWAVLFRGPDGSWHYRGGELSGVWFSTKKLAERYAKSLKNRKDFHIVKLGPVRVPE